MPDRTNRRIIEHQLALLFVWVLISIGTSAQAQTRDELAKFQTVLINGNNEEKRNALFNLRNFESPEASEVAKTSLKDPDELVRATAAGAVVYANDASLFIAPLLEDQFPFVRKEAAYSIARTGNADIFTRTRLANMIFDDKFAGVKSASAFALGYVGNEDAVPVLTRVFSKFTKKQMEFLRRTSAHSIGQIAERLQEQVPNRTTPASFLPEEYKTLKKPKYMRLAESFPAFGVANQALLRIANDPKSSDDEIREAVFALGEIGDISSLKTIRKFVSSGDPYLSEIAKEALLRAEASVNYSLSDKRPDS